MGLIFAVPGDTANTWGVVTNQWGSTVEQHTHEPGKGAPIVAASLNIDNDVNWHAYALTAAKTITFTEVAPTTMVGYANGFFVSLTDHNLYFRNGGTNIAVTSGATLAVNSIGGIGGDYAAVGALESWDAATSRYLFQGPAGPTRAWGGVACGDIDLYQKAISIANKVTLKSPNALAASYAYTFPAALPSGTAPLTVDNTGALTNGSSFSMLSNANITLSGTGTYKHGTKTKRIPVWNSTVSTASATTQSAGTQGITLPNNAAVFVPLPPVAMHERWVVAEIWFASAADATACTCELFATSGSATDTGLMTTTSQFLASGGTAVAQAAINISPANCKQLWVKVTNSISTPHITACGIGYDAP